MAMRQFVITLTGTGSLKQISSGISGTFNDPILKQISIQPGRDNGGIVYVGDSNLSTVAFGEILPIPVAAVPAAPTQHDFPPGSSVRASDIYVLGSNGDKVYGFVTW